jgi:signal recognition particle subunit SRP54
MMKQMGGMMGLPGRRKATKSPKNKRKGTKGGGRPRAGGMPTGLPGGMPALPPGLDPNGFDPTAGAGAFKPPKIDFSKLKRDNK